MSRRIKKKSSNIDTASNSTKAEVKIDKNVYDHLRPDKIKQKAEVTQIATGSSINTFLVISLIGIVIVAMTLSGVFQGGLDLGTGTNDENTFINNFDSVLTKDVCMNPSHSTVVSHYHISVSVFVNDVQQIIPAEIGIYPSCMKPIHTHGVDGTLHVELPSGFDNTPNLGDFFAIWGEWSGDLMNIGFTQLMGNTGTVTMTSDGFTVSTNPAQYLLLAGGSENEFIELRLN